MSDDIKALQSDALSARTTAPKFTRSSLSRRYFHTALQWARNFDHNRDAVIARFGEFNYRRFRLYLWGTAYQFLSRGLSCYRMIIHSPGAPPSSGEHLGASGPGPQKACQ